MFSLQMTNYHQLILNSQSKIENLEAEIEEIKIEILPNLKREKARIYDELRKLKHRLEVELPNEIVKIEEEINKYLYQKSNGYAQKNSIVGDYIIHNNPVKPKKSLIVIISFLIGFMLSIFIVLF